MDNKLQIIIIGRTHKMTAFNFCTMTAYSGQNAAISGNGKLPAFATFNQLKSNGYMVRKGAKSISIHCGYHKVEDKKTKKLVTIPKYARVFDIIDTTAADDKDFIAWLAEEAEAGRVKGVSKTKEAVTTSDMPFASL